MNNVEENTNLVLFNNNKIRRQEYKGEWYYSVVDIIEILTESIDAGAYWRVMKKRLLKEANESVTNCYALKLISKKDGKSYKTDCANRETIFRIIQSVPSPNAEPFKMWFAHLAEVTTTEIHKANDSQGIDKLTKDAKDGGEIASITRKNIENKIGKSVITCENVIDFNNNKKLQ